MSQAVALAVGITSAQIGLALRFFIRRKEL
jgi:hypothetical protein